MSTSNMPQRLASDTDPYKLSTRKNIAQASSQVNRFAKRDPALYPLSIILVAVAGVTGYFAMNKMSTPTMERSLAQRGMVQPWEETDKQDLMPNQVAAFKYRYKTREGHMEDSMPTINVDVRRVNSDGPHKYHT